MQELEKLLALCVFGAMASVVVKNLAPSFSALLVIFVSVCVVGLCVFCVIPFVDFFYSLVQGTSFSVYASVLFRVCGIAALSGVAAEICKDAGESAFASKAMLAGKMAILLCALPVLKSLIEQVKDMLN
ncbi:MAG: hypothetical protein E7656_00985 [Ruminococcaceae bacterium]|nr:hypothetical protein [Oscillospiraceae bacterium]